MPVSWEVLQRSSKAYDCRQVCHHRGTGGFLAGPSASTQPVTQTQHCAIAWPTTETSPDSIPDGISLLTQSKTRLSSRLPRIWGMPTLTSHVHLPETSPYSSALPRSSPAAVRTGIGGGAEHVPAGNGHTALRSFVLLPQHKLCSRTGSKNLQWSSFF